MKIQNTLKYYWLSSGESLYIAEWHQNKKTFQYLDGKSNRGLFPRKIIPKHTIIYIPKSIGY